MIYYVYIYISLVMIGHCRSLSVILCHYSIYHYISLYIYIYVYSPMPICVDVDICTQNPVQGTVPVPLETEPYLLASEYQELRAGADGGADGGRPQWWSFRWVF